MTLNEFCESRNISPPDRGENGVSAIIPLGTPHLTDLYNLEDFVVSSRSGDVVWFVPRRSRPQRIHWVAE